MGRGRSPRRSGSARSQASNREVTWVCVGIRVKEHASISDPFKSRRMHYLISHSYDTVAYIKDLEIGVHKFRNADITLEDIPFHMWQSQWRVLELLGWGCGESKWWGRIHSMNSKEEMDGKGCSTVSSCRWLVQGTDEGLLRLGFCPGASKVLTCLHN